MTDREPGFYWLNDEPAQWDEAGFWWVIGWDSEIKTHDRTVGPRIDRDETERLKARVAELEAALGIAERHIIGMYRGACPAANTDDGNRFAETDEAVVAIRTALKGS